MKMARVLQRLVPSKGLRVIFRSLSKTSRDSSTQNAKTKLGFFDKLWDMGELAPYIDAHSKTLTANPACYELVCKYFSLYTSCANLCSKFFPLVLPLDIRST